MTHLPRRRAAAVLGLTLLIGLPTAIATLPHAVAQSQSTKVVVGFAPGGSVDALARMAADAIATSTGRPAIVENKTGAGGRIAVDLVKSSAPDGDTLLVAPQGPMTLFTHVFKDKLKYDPATDFSPITRLATADFALTVGPLAPVKDLAGFKAWLRTARDKASFGSPGAGTLPHFVGLAAGDQLGVPLIHVPYQGSARSMVDLAGGTIAAAVSPVTEALELHKAGKVRIIATTGSQRSPFVPDVPTFKESGFDLDVPLWFALYGPAGIPAPTVEKLRKAVDAAFATPDGSQRLARLGLVHAPLAPAELEALRQRESAMWAPVVKASGFTPGN